MTKVCDEIRNYVVIDLEMTGLSPKTDKIIEIGAIKVVDKKVSSTYSMLVNSKATVPQKVIELTGITNEMVSTGVEEDEALKGLIDFIGDNAIVGQNIQFDYNFIKQWAINHKIPLQLKAYDTLKLARKLLPAQQPKNLEALCVYFDVKRENAHRALDDALETRDIFEKLLEMYDEDKLEPKVLTYKAKRQTPATKQQIERLKETIEKYNIEEPINWESLTRNEASRLMNKFQILIWQKQNS